MFGDFDLLARGAATGLFTLVALVLWRDHKRALAGRLAAAFALSGAAHTLTLTPDLCEALGLTSLPIVALSVGGSAAFWLFSRAVFSDDFRLRPWRIAVWAGLAAAGAIRGFVLMPVGGPAFRAANLALDGAAIVLALLALKPVIAGWASDLVEPRRRARVLIIGASGAYVVAWTATRASNSLAALSDLNAGALLAIAFGVAWLTLGGDRAKPLFIAEASPSQSPETLEGADAALARALDAAMTRERAYRQDGLSIGALAQRLSVPEHRLRRVINQGLGHANFNAFVNGYRIAEAKSALADPTQATVPVATIALDAGFASLGPFNRAFKAATGLTPSEFRRRRLAESEIGKRKPKSGAQEATADSKEQAQPQ